MSNETYMGRELEDGELDLSNMNLTEIPKDLPSSLKWLGLSDNKITKIENLPSSLDWLSISNNNITKIENLPSSLVKLYIDNNIITKLEDNQQYLKDIVKF